MARRRRDTNLPPPFLKRVWLPERDEQEWPNSVDWEAYPLNLPMIANAGADIRFDKSVTIIVGENGSGKSTILEAIAHAAGFSDRGGGVGISGVGDAPASGRDAGFLGGLLKALWLPQIKRGWFFGPRPSFRLLAILTKSAPKTQTSSLRLMGRASWPFLKSG